MPKPLPVTFQDVYANVSADLTRRIGDAQAALSGPPVTSDIVPATDETRVNAWNARNPEATDQAMLALALQKYQEHLHRGLDPALAQKATAEDLTHFRYSQRLKLYTYGQVSFEDQVEEARRLKRLAERRTTPNPPLPPPTQPSAALTNLQTMDLPTAPPGELPPGPMELAASSAPAVPGGLPAPELPQAAPTGTSPEPPEVTRHGY